MGTRAPDQARRVHADMRVVEVLRSDPRAIEVFRANGCPDMRTGFFALMARIMKVRWAARVHKVPLDKLLAELNDPGP